ncbi:RutC family protein [Virgibacillus pantothenticus]|uniref:Endoribonuclease L-PSP n=1 Tax=Virgibacillus pantothenticus TaxID=1473 RepID=A0A0L0QTD8_VIRPA|nr:MULTISPECIES: RidA family protein [Virgibacillus]API91913.1 reactive intermediate/imine deaminase [Virgibacillus sp. 6R]KNE21448.1 endoribonuclease L-PSP [Virgibacillus pantothenticus]MBS7430364.1 RidA family protein [Virgibacillus sp. 19R1-5]MBU8567366.1 RidA family protein [Virgibacillus pantothenticus]MBU8598947.1 RidA family protein [Virgibacillus pantothenticus]
MNKAIHTEKAPAALGPYSQAVAAGDFLYVSGQIGIDPTTGEMTEGIENQTKQVLKNIQAILEKAGTDLTKAAKFSIYLKSMDDFSTVNEIYGSYLQEPYPARSTIEVSKLPKDALVEMDVILHLKA